MKTFETIIMVRSYHTVRVEAESIEEAIDIFNSDWDRFILTEELYDRASWDIDSIDNIEEVNPDNEDGF